MAVQPTHTEVIRLPGRERVLHIANYKTTSVGTFGTGYLEEGDGYIIVCGTRVLLTEAQIAELRAARTSEDRKAKEEARTHEETIIESANTLAQQFSTRASAVLSLAAKAENEEDRAESLEKDRELFTNIPIISPEPAIVCLCGSTRFWREFQRASLRETMAGRIVLSIGAATGTDDEHFGNLSPEQYESLKESLDTLHLRKIMLADEVLILNVDDYIGQSTRRELQFARDCGKLVRWLEPSDHQQYGERVG